jgi:hypothetical protein
MERSIKRQLTAVGVSGVLALGVLATLPQAYWPKCPIYWTTGIHCPGCGGLRATSALLDGNFVAALNQNIFVFLAPVLVGVGFLVPRAKKPHLTKTFIAVVAVVALVYTILRNLPGSWMAPDPLATAI